MNILKNIFSVIGAIIVVGMLIAYAKFDLGAEGDF